MAKRHECVTNMSVHCTKGSGVPKRRKCAWCGSGFLVEEGVYGVFEWRGDGRYKLEDAKRVYQSRLAADKFIGGRALVSRFIGKVI